MATNLALSAPAFSLAFADAGGIRAAAVLAAAPSSRLVQPAPQARAAVLLAVLARLPALAAELALAADDAPELAAAAAAAVTAAAGDSASGDADPAADDAEPLDDTTSGALSAAMACHPPPLLGYIWGLFAWIHQALRRRAHRTGASVSAAACRCGRRGPR